MSQEAPDRTYWVVAVLGSGDETKIGESFFIQGMVRGY